MKLRLKFLMLFLQRFECRLSSAARYLALQAAIEIYGILHSSILAGTTAAALALQIFAPGLHIQLACGAVVLRLCLTVQGPGLFLLQWFWPVHEVALSLLLFDLLPSNGSNLAFDIFQF